MGQHWKDSARRQFDGWSRSYDRSLLQRWFFGPSHQAVLDTVDLRPGDHVLDMGCGTGRFLRRLLSSHSEVTATGLDLSAGMLANAQSNNADLDDRVDWVEGDSEHLPFADNTFDLVTCIHSFHHYPHQDAVVREIYRVLKPTGQAVIVDGDRDGWWGWVVFDGVVTTIEGAVHHCSRREFHQIFEEAGFGATSDRAGNYWAPFVVLHAEALKSSQAVRRAA